MNERLMRHRREYVTLQMELSEITSAIAVDINALYDWVAAMAKLNGNLESYPDRFCTPFLQTEGNIVRLRRIQHNHLKARDIREKMEKLRPLAA